MRLGMTPPAVLKLSSASRKKVFNGNLAVPIVLPEEEFDLGFLVGGEFQDHGPRCRWGTGLPDYHVSCRQSAVSERYVKLVSARRVSLLTGPLFSIGWP